MPRNPAKITDSRAYGYIKRFGNKSWELDALEPKVITALIRKTVLSFRDETKWKAAVAKQQRGRDRLTEIAENL